MRMPGRTSGVSSRTRLLAVSASHMGRRKPLAIEDYALIGDLQTAALVGKDGSIDWLCLPSFSSGACFAAILGTPKNGRWLLRPRDACTTVSRRYQPGTLILETTFHTDTGSVMVTDFMPVRGTNPDIVRVVTGLTGDVQMFSELILRFDYGYSVPWVTGVAEGLRAISGPAMVILRTAVECHGEDLSTVSDFRVRAGEEQSFVLTYGPSHLPLPKPIDWRRALKFTQNYWRRWIKSSRYRGPYKEAVERSLITLKALTYRPTGGIVAAPTTSLPEKFGDGRNWDYRYCWLRDTTFTLLALMNAGFHEEARQWHDWLLRALAGAANQVQIMYGLFGERRLPEMELPHLDGYQGAKPVRIGNEASEQTQLDIFGEVLDGLFHGLEMAHDGGSFTKTPARRAAENLPLVSSLLEHLGTIWDKPDHGIWEIRGKPRHYVHSKVMAWVAYDRAVRIADRFGIHDTEAHPVNKWRKLRDRIHRQVCRHGFDSRLNSFVQAYGSTELDASLLLLPLVGFLPPEDPRIVGTIAAVEKNLLRDGFVMRYRPNPKVDRQQAGEGVFLACSFWMVTNLKLQRRDDDAHAMFQSLMKVRNDLGLLSEEYEPRSRRLAGNFPQAFSHIAMISAAFALRADVEQLEKRARHKTLSRTGRKDPPPVK